MQEKIKELPDPPASTAADAIADAEQGAPLLRDFSESEEDEDEIPAPHSKHDRR